MSEEMNNETPVTDPAPVLDNEPAPQDATTPEPPAGGLLGGEEPAKAPQEASTDVEWSLEAGDSGIEGDDLKNLEKWAKELGMSKEMAEKVRDRHAADRANYSSMMQQQDNNWQRELYADPEFGGKNWDSTVTNARRALREYDPTGEAMTLLQETGYGSNPVIVRLLARIGRDMQEDRLVTGKGGAHTAPLEERLYNK